MVKTIPDLVFEHSSSRLHNYNYQLISRTSQGFPFAILNYLQHNTLVQTQKKVSNNYFPLENQSCLTNDSVSKFKFVLWPPLFFNLVNLVHIRLLLGMLMSLQCLGLYFLQNSALILSRAAVTARCVPGSSVLPAERGPLRWTDPVLSGSAPWHEHMTTKLEGVEEGGSTEYQLNSLSRK